jgi:hypothetical protein
VRRQSAQNDRSRAWQNVGTRQNTKAELFQREALHHPLRHRPQFEGPQQRRLLHFGCAVVKEVGRGHQVCGAPHEQDRVSHEECQLRSEHDELALLNRVEPARIESIQKVVSELGRPRISCRSGRRQQSIFPIGGGRREIGGAGQQASLRNEATPACRPLRRGLESVGDGGVGAVGSFGGMPRFDVDETECGSGGAERQVSPAAVADGCRSVDSGAHERMTKCNGISDQYQPRSFRLVATIG